MTILLRKQKNIKCSTVETHHFSLGIASQNKKINEINGCKTIFAAHRAQRATNSTQQQPNGTQHKLTILVGVKSIILPQTKKVPVER